MTNRIAFIGLLLVLALPCFGQNVVTTVPNATIAVCAHPANAVPCTNYVTTYTDVSMGSACPNNAQIVAAGTSSCVSTSDAYGNFGYWAAPGCHDYTIVTSSNQAIGPYYDCSSATNPLTIAGSGDTSFDAFRLRMTTQGGKGVLNGDFLDSTGAVTSAIHPLANYTYFSPAGGSTFSAGMWLFPSATWLWDATGGLPINGTLNSFEQSDPSTTLCTVTHSGSGGGGVTYYVAFLDANSGKTKWSPGCTDAGGFASPDVSHTNTVTWWQPQTSDGDGGSASNVIIARSNTSTGVLDNSGSGVLSRFSACIYPGTLSSPPTDASCKMTDDGSLSTVSIATLMGIFYPDDNGNSTAKVTTQQLYTLQRGAYIGGGAQVPGGILTENLLTPAAPGVSVNTTGASTCVYELQVFTFAGKHTGTGSQTSVANCAATRDNTISWTDQQIGCYYVNVLLYTGGSHYKIAEKQPCYGYNTAGGFGTPAAATFHDANAATTLVTDTGDTSADVTVPGTTTSTYVIGTSNLTAWNFLFADNPDPTQGYFRADTGDTTHAGQWHLFGAHATAAVDLYSCGGDASTDLTCRGANNGTLFMQDVKGIGLVSAGGGTRYPITTNGTSVAINGHNFFTVAGKLDAGALAATTAVAPAAALGSGSPSATTALFGDTTYKQTMTTSGTPTAGQAVCYLSATVLGKCTSAVGAGGACTCAAN